MEAHARIDIGDWIVHAALAGASEIDVLAGVCERMNDAGLRLVRASVANNLLDPTYDARGVRWLRDGGGLEEAFERVDDSLPNEDRARSPFFALVESGRTMLRRRLDASYRRADCELLDG